MGCVIKYKGQSIPEEQFLQYLNKQITINNLFNENKTLANAVYEALGFYNPIVHNKIVSINNTNFGDEAPSVENKLSFNLKDIEIEEFNDIINTGKATIYFSVPKEKSITFGQRASGIIGQMMLHRENNIVTISSVALYSPNIRIGEKQLRLNESKGIGKYIYELVGDKLLKEHGLILRSDTSRSVGAEKVWSYFEKNNKAEKLEDGRYYYKSNQITPQQKQQAQQLYSQYLDTIFPDSKVKDIVYHDSPSKIEEFKKSYIFTGDGGQIGAGFYFWNEKTEKYNGRKFKIPSLINLEKPLDINSLPKTESSNYFYSDLKKRGYDILAIQNYTENYFGELRIKEGYEKAGMEDKSFFKNMEKEKTLPYIMKKEYDIDGSFSLFGQNNKQFVVFEPEQIHILSSKKDLEMFRNFINFTKSEYAKYGDIQQFKDYIMSKNFAAIEEFLVVNNKIDRKC